MHHLRRFGVPVLVVALILIVFPMLDFVQAVWPVQVGDIKWRVLSMGSLAQLMGLPILGLLMAYGGAVLLEQPKLLRTLAIVNGVMFTFLALGVLFYVVDALQMRAQARDATVKDYDLGIVTSLVRFAIALVFLAVVAVMERRASKEIAGEVRIAGQGPPPLVFRHPESKADSPGGHAG
jgi:hypothetical protein